MTTERALKMQGRYIKLQFLKIITRKEIKVGNPLKTVSKKKKMIWTIFNNKKKSKVTSCGL